MRNDQKNFTAHIYIKFFFIFYLIYKASFIVSWTPYAAVCFYVAFVSEDVPPLVGTLPAMFAKLSFLTSSIIYAYSNTVTREEFKQVYNIKPRLFKSQLSPKPLRPEIKLSKNLGIFLIEILKKIFSKKVLFSLLKVK